MAPSETDTYDEAGSIRQPIATARRPHLVLIFEYERPAAWGEAFDLQGVDEVVIGRGPMRSSTRTTTDGLTTVRVTVPAKALSQRHARLLRAQGQWVLEDLGSRNGTMVNGETVTRAALREGDLLEMGRTMFSLREVFALSTSGPTSRLATFHAELATRYSEVERLATSKVPFLVTGETGTGKEIAARAIHALSGRRGAFVAVNCAALTSTLLEAQLFGHVKGAFSGAARDELGLVRSADQGTLLLDEIGELPATQQAALLRVLQEGQVTPVGSARAIPVDVRFLAATNRPLEDEVARGAFRADLFARINGHTLRLPPLRERKDDLGLLIANILRDQLGGDAESVVFSPPAARALLAYDWPFNVRELQQTLTRAVILAAGKPIDTSHLPFATTASVEVPARRSSPEVDPRLGDEDVRLRALLIRNLREERGNVAAVARRMAKAPMQIHRWMSRLGIDPNAYRQ